MVCKGGVGKCVHVVRWRVWCICVWLGDRKVWCVCVCAHACVCMCVCVRVFVCVHESANVVPFMHHCVLE